MKKLALFFGFLLLIFIATRYQSKKNTFDQALSDFSVEDTASITKVFFADKYNHTVTLNKVESEWLVEEKYPIRKDALKYLLSTIKNLRVKHPVSNSLHDKIVKNLATSSVKVEIFTNNEKEAFKTYFVGGESKDMIGSYMLMENSNRAFVVYLPGFSGFLAPRYNIDGTVISSDLWRDRTIFSISNNKLKSVKVINHEDSLSSFRIERVANQFFLTKNNETKSISAKNGVKYFNLFKQVNCEGFMNDFSLKDSILNSKPFYTIEVQKTDNQLIILKCYHKELDRINYTELNDKEETYDTDRLYAQLNDDFILIQFYVFDKILLRASNFSVEK